MGYTSPATVVTATTISTSTFGNIVKGDLDFLANPPACRAYHNAAQALTTGVEASLALNSERYDTDTMHDTVTNNSRLTIKTAGLYIITGHVEFANNATGYRLGGLRVNNTTTIAV